MLTPRAYQNDAINEVKKALINGYKSPLLVIPTGGGKTIIFTMITQGAAIKNKRVLILVHRVELLRQTIDKLSQFGVEYGVIHPKYTPDYTKNVQVASVQTLIKRLDKYDKFDMVIIDEAHHATAGTWNKIINHYDCLNLGVTATPCRSDGKGLDDVFDILLQGPQISELIDLGYLVEPVIYGVPDSQKIDVSGVGKVAGDYNTKELSELVNKPVITGNAVAHYRKYASGKPCVVFCINVQHAKDVAAEFQLAGYKAFSVDGEMDDETRKRILNGLENGQTEVVTSCNLISEGTDIPAIECIILLRHTHSLSLYLQQIGRGLRVAFGKSSCIILDHVGNVSRHGLPTMDRVWSLTGNKAKGKQRESERTISVYQCEECYFVYDGNFKECPSCGAERKQTRAELEIIEGELTRITQEQEKKDKKIEIGRARTYAELLEIEKQRGYKKGWAAHLLKARESKIRN